MYVSEKNLHNVCDNFPKERVFQLKLLFLYNDIVLFVIQFPFEKLSARIVLNKSNIVSVFLFPLAFTFQLFYIKSIWYALKDTLLVIITSVFQRFPSNKKVDIHFLTFSNIPFHRLIKCLINNSSSSAQPACGISRTRHTP